MLKEALSRMAKVFLPTVLMHGQEYQQKGFVLSTRLSDGLLKARVKGRSSQIYDIHIDLKSWPTQPAQCSCQYKINCKHAAASLFALQIRENYTIPAPTGSKAEHSLNDWLSSLREKEVEERKPEPSYEVMYLLEPQFGEHEHRVLLRLALAKRLKKGGWGKKTIFNTLTESRKQYFQANDEEIIAGLLFKSGSHEWFDRLAIRNSELLEKILRTGRTYLGEQDGLPIAYSDQLEAVLRWRLANTGLQTLTLEAEGEEILPLFLDMPWYFDRESNLLGPLVIPYTPSQLKKILSVPPVDLDDAPMVAQKMAENSPELPLPRLFEQRTLRKLRPQIYLSFDAFELDKTTANREDEASHLFVVRLSFDYEGVIIESNNDSLSVYHAEENELIEIQRDLAFEKEVDEELQLMLSLRSPDLTERLRSTTDIRYERVLAHYKNEEDLSRLYNQVIPLLKKKGWQVKFVHSVYEEIVDADELEWFSELDEKGNDFFSYQLGIVIEGKTVGVVPLVAELIGRLDRDNIDSIADDQRFKLPLPDGKILQVSFGRIKPLIRFLLQYGTRHIKDSQKLEINRYQLVLMQETEQAMAAISARWQGSDSLKAQLRQLVNLDALPTIELPVGLHATLRDYQHQGVNWLQFLRISRFGGVLADDMGLGKTVQTLAHLQVEKEQGRLGKASLIVAPTSLVGNWFEEARRFTPELKVLIFHGVERHQDQFDDYDLVISTYGLIQRDKSRFTEYSFYYLILDEAQSIKNARTKTTQIIQQIQAKHRLCLSGTPLENHLGELWSLFHFLMPGLLGDAKQFRQFFQNPIEKMADADRRALLARRVQPFMLRRNKNQVASELPDKTEMTRTIELSGAQRDLYEAIRMSMEKKVREAIAKQGMGKSHIVILDALLKLRQVCCDPKLLSIPEAEIAHGTSAKLDTLMDLLDNLIEEGRRVLVFSQFTSMLQLIEIELNKRQYGYLKLTGQTQNRQNLVNTFQEGKVPIFLISLKAGGTGLNLTKADTVIHYDPWWNPAVEDQATDRSHRIGQENPVFVYKLITAGTVEETILAMQEKKRQLFEGILSDNATGMTALTPTDVEQFFMPLPVE